LSKYIKKLEGERIYLSPIFTDDIEKYVKWMNDLEVTKFLGALSTENYTIEREKDFLEKMAKEKFNFAIVLKDGDRLIGNISLFAVNHLYQIGEVGLFIGEEDDRGNGYGKEALKLILNYGFGYLNLNNIMLRLNGANKIAYNAYKKVGFKEFGRRSSCCYVENKWYDEIYMEILKKDFKL
jgi:RimJ/RimL family protein N-acetyltransferase